MEVVKGTLLSVADQAAQELAKENADKAKTQIKDSLRKIHQAKQVVQNLELAHEALLRDLAAGGVQ